MGEMPGFYNHFFSTIAGKTFSGSDFYQISHFHLNHYLCPALNDWFAFGWTIDNNPKVKNE